MFRENTVRRSVVARAVLAAALAGCIPLPIPHTAQVTPRVIGALRRDDGRPIAGVVVGVSTRDDDRTCSRSGARDTTDAAGHFQLPAIRERRRVFWLSLMENFGLMGYWLCARSADSLPMTTNDLRSSVSGHIAGDSLLCLRWEERRAQRLVCEALSRPHRIIEGGQWADGGGSGHYRLLLVDADDYGYASHLAVQWIDSSATAGAARVLATAESAAGEAVRSWPAPQLVDREGHWYATITAERQTKWANDRHLVLELGPPGVVRLLPDSIRNRLFRRSP